MGRAAAIAFAREGADVAFGYLPQKESDAQEGSARPGARPCRCRATSASTRSRRARSGRPCSPAAASRPKLPDFGADTPAKRPGQPAELASLYVPLASDEDSFTTGQVFGATGGKGP